MFRFWLDPWISLAPLFMVSPSLSPGKSTFCFYPVSLPFQERFKSLGPRPPALASRFRSSRLSGVILSDHLFPTSTKWGRLPLLGPVSFRDLHCGPLPARPLSHECGSVLYHSGSNSSYGWPCGVRSLLLTSSKLEVSKFLIGV
ncbi:hypothetical protein AMTRI_Chr11g98730 [Amborella trichopoda]